MHYLDNYRDHLERWEREHVTDIDCALERLGATPLRSGGPRTFRILHAIDRMIDNLNYPGGPDLTREQVTTSAYNYIFAAPYDRRFAALTPAELCYRLREAGVSETELQVQSYERILSGERSATYRIVPLKEGKAYALRPVQPFTLTVAPDGTFPLQLHSVAGREQSVKEGNPGVLSPPKVSAKRKTTSPTKKTTAAGQKKIVAPAGKIGRGSKPRSRIQ